MDKNNLRMNEMSQGERMQNYYSSGRMLMSLATAVGRLTLATRELTRLAGFTARMSSLHKVLGDLNEERYERTVVHQADDPAAGVLAGEVTPVELRSHGVTHEVTDLIKFENVPLVTPNGDRLVESLNLEVRAGMNVLVCGPNGCGKSSMFRVLGGLWPLAGGVLHKPPRSKLFYVPQRPYLTIGTLRDQVIYPHAKEEVDCDDEQLRTYLRYVQLDYLVDRDGWDGWDTVRDWKDVLSGGEKQRLALARLFFNRPLYGILDECTSAVSVDVEGSMYELCREMGITLFTISHRKSLWRHHQYVLYFDGQGNYKFGPREEMNIEYGS
jgi:ATP-binding cassette, subfamily D (ALD), member 3